MDFRQTTVVLDGKEYPVYFNLVALMKFAKQTGKSLNDILTDLATNLDVLAMVPLFRLGLYYGAKKTGQDFTLTDDDVEDIIALDSKALNALTVALTESMPKGEELEVDDSAEKKEMPATD